MPPVVKRQAPIPSKKQAKKGNILDRIAPVKPNFSRIKLSVYGRSGTGKTTFAASFPKPMLIFGFEEGTNSVHDVEGLDFFLVRTSDDIYEVLSAGVDTKYKSFLVDTASTLQDMVLKELLGLEELPPQRSWGMATQQQWGQVALKTKEYLREFLNLPGNVVINAQEREFKASEDNEIVVPNVGSALSPSVTGWLNPACDYIGQTFIKEETIVKKTTIGTKVVATTVKTGKMQYCLRVGPSDIFTTKFRLPKGTALPEYLIDPSYDKIVNLISGKV